MVLFGWAAFVALCSLPRGYAPGPGRFVTIAGWPKAGTSQLHNVISEHPQVFALTKEHCHGQERFGLTDAMQFGSMLQLMVSQEGNVSKDHLVELCVREVADDSKKCKAFFKNAKEASTHGEVTYLNTCIKPSHGASEIQRAAPVRNAKVLFTVRDPADLAWASYNFWLNKADNGEVKGWAGQDTFRSPEHFHELAISDGKLRASEHMISFPHIITTMRELENTFGSNNCYFLRSEDLNDVEVMRRMFKFLELDFESLPAATLKKRSNSGALVSGKGAKSSANHVYADGVYQVSGFRPMLCKTRRFIYERSLGACVQLKDNFSIEYLGCLENKLDCGESGLLISVPLLACVIFAVLVLGFILGQVVAKRCGRLVPQVVVHEERGGYTVVGQLAHEDHE